MKNYKQNFELIIGDSADLNNKLKLYFNFYSFIEIKDENNHLFFLKNYSLFDGWKINPLKWETKINVNLIEEN